MRRTCRTAAFVALVCLALASGARGAESSSASAVQHYIEGQRYLQQGFLERAERELEEAVRIDPDYLDALSSLALVYLKRGKMTHYRAVLDRAVAVKARQSSPAERPRPRLKPLEPPPGPASTPEAPEPPTTARAPEAAPPVFSHPEPEPEPKPEPREVFILESRGKRDSLGQFRIEGEIKNNTPLTVRRVEVSLVAFNSQGKSIDPATTYRGPWELKPGEKAPFSIDLTDSADKVERFELKPSWESVTQ